MLISSREVQHIYQQRWRGSTGLSPRVERVCDSLEMSPTAGVAAGSIASGVLCAALTHPFDTCKSIIQGDLECGGLSATARALYAENGIQGFFRGYPARAAMICCCFFIFVVSVCWARAGR